MKKLVDHRILVEKAKGNWGIAEDWAKESDYDSAADRYYYSVLQLALSYAVRKRVPELEKYESQRSGNTVHFLMSLVVGRISPCYRRAMLELYRIRREVDYRSSSVDRDDLDDVLDDVRKLKGEIEALVA